MPHLYSNQKLGHSPDLLEERQNALLQFIRQTLPELMSDNQLDFNKLKSWLDDTGAAAPDEHYELTWADKNRCTHCTSVAHASVFP
jgi:adenine-specific DNA-methyltransferase